MKSTGIKATYWRCHQCNSQNLWEIAPACITCDHRRCSNCTPSRNGKPDPAPRVLYVDKPQSVPQNSQKGPPFWKCHRCLTQCRRGSDTAGSSWSCEVCHHSVCWECSASFENAAVGMRIPALIGALGPNSSALPQAPHGLHNLENSSIEVTVGSRTPLNVGLLAEQFVATVISDLTTTNDTDSSSELKVPQMRALREDLSEKTFASKETLKNRDIATQTFEELQLGHDEALAAPSSSQVLLSYVERNRAIPKAEMDVDSREHLPESLIRETAKSTPGLCTKKPDHPTSFHGREGFRDPPATAASSSVEAEIGHLAKKDLRDIQIQGETPSNDEASDQTSLDEGWGTPYGSDGEMEFAGIYRDHSGHLASLETVEPIFMNDVIAQLVGAYLEDMEFCHAGQRQCATGRNSVSHDQPNTTASRNPTIPSKRGSKPRRERIEDPDESANLQISQKRIKKDHQSQGKKLFACPYSKHDKRRYSEHNMNEKHYRHCSSTYGLTIHRIKQHLYRVHKRPDFYCSRCFTVLESRELFDKHIRASLPCSLNFCPFGEKMTQDQMATIRKRATTGDQVTAWYTIYETLFPGSSKPDSPYAEEISPESVEDFEQWFIGQELVLRDIFAARVARDLPLLPQEERNILEAVLEECLLELARLRGRNFDSPPAEAGPSNWRPADFDTQATTALEAAQELALRDTHEDVPKSESNEDCPTTASSHSQQDPMAEGEVQEFCLASSPAQVPTSPPQEEQEPLWDALFMEDWAMLDSSLNFVDTFGAYMEGMGHDLDLSVVLKQGEGEVVDKQPDIGVEVTTCAAKHKGKGKARGHDG